jgi:uncharacterized protein
MINYGVDNEVFELFIFTFTMLVGLFTSPAVLTMPHPGFNVQFYFLLFTFYFLLFTFYFLLKKMLEFIRQPWSWYASGTAIALIMTTLLVFGKSFGFSSNLRTICSMLGAGKKLKFFDFDWQSQKWNLYFLLGSILGGFIASTWLDSGTPLQLSAATVSDIQALGINFDGGLNPAELFGPEAFGSPKTLLVLLSGGILIGFGTRYAGGCTSGHAISGLSNLQIPSFIAVIGFFAGGLIMTHLLLPLIF